METRFLYCNSDSNSSVWFFPYPQAILRQRQGALQMEGLTCYFNTVELPFCPCDFNLFKLL